MKTPDETRPLNGGEQRLFRFTNGYTASVVRHSFSQGGRAGLWELAVLYNGKLVYDTPITDDVVGRLSESEVDETLARIEALPVRSYAQRDSGATRYIKSRERIMKKHIVVGGDPLCGFGFTGPFETEDEAVSWAEANIQGDWWIAPLYSQNESEEGKS